MPALVTLFTPDNQVNLSVLRAALQADGFFELAAM
jgi:hypothetical protein